MTDNLKLWDYIAETDPAHTKRINQRGGFTAIDTYHQIYLLTKTFGPAGTGWGWEVEEVQYPPNDTVWVKIRFWHGSRDSWFHAFGQKELNSGQRDGKPRADEDALKKALADAIGKAASYIGCNADVYLGKFDDNKYVQGLIDKREKTTAADIDHYGGTPEKLKEWCEGEIRAAQSFDDYREIFRTLSPERKLLKDTAPAIYSAFEAECERFSRALPGHPMTDAFNL